MAKIKIHEIAKKYDLTSKEVLDKAVELGIDAKSHLSSIEGNDIKRLEDALGVKSKSGSKAQGTDKKEKEKKKENTPVIIRREVILNEDNNQEKVTKKPEEKNIGFVERNKNQNYNIVYRNKQQKPMTAAELFGFKDKKKEEEEKKKKEAEALRIKEEEAKKAAEKKKIADEEEAKKLKEKTEKTDNNTMEVATRRESVRTADNYENRRPNTNTRFNNNNGERRFNNNRDGQVNNRFNNNNQDRRFNGNRDQSNNNFRNNRYNNDGNNRFNNNNRYNNDGNGRYNNSGRPLDNKGIDKNIKDIMSVEIVEKESQRDYSSKSIDKAKQNKFEENKANNTAKKNTKNRRQDRFSEFDGSKLKDLKQADRLSHMFNEQDGGMLDYYDLTSGRSKKNKKKNMKADEEGGSKQKIFQLTEITIPENITVKDLATELKKTSGEVITKLMSLGIMATINNELDFDTAFLVASEFGVTATKKEVVNEEDVLFDESEDREEDLLPRPPVVVVMGHVDHGKTSLLDAIRKTNVIEGEAGGITQHIGAYKVNVNGREITFLDTPGHEAFTSMRARGAQITDIAILVVAADDGVMPQTVEAINHAKAAEIPIIVAVNKIDLPDANIEKIKQDLMQYDLVSEEWGGDTIFVPISAKKGLNINNLLEMVLLVADMKELKANPNKQSKGAVIEARLDKAKGPIASMLVQRGTLNVGDTIVVGTSIGRIRAMKNDKGQSVKEAGPSTPVEVMGLTEVPEAGDTFYEVKNEKMAKHLIEKRKLQEREKSLSNTNVVTLNNLFEKMESENLKQLNLIVKADVQGSSEAIKQSLEKLSNDEVKVKVIHSVAGAVNESDVQLAKAAEAIIIAFNVRPVGSAKEMAEKEGVEIKQYSIIYKAIEDVEAAMKGLLDPIYEEKVIGNAQVRQTFKVSSVGTIAGCYVLDGKVERNAGVRVIRDSVVIHEGKLASLKRFKDDVKEVTKGFECGCQIEDYNDLKEDDIIEFFVMEEVKR
ncbi:MAG: translation initiation factor IF-2 [Clostridia bacterium]|nr:translation initiation factor IF-2 [Clostridia bacterium]